MKKSILLIILVCFSIPWIRVAHAEPVVLINQQIVDFLSGEKITGNQNGTEWFQTFAAGGYTSYEEVNGFRPASGLWKAEGNKYCSQWPPASNWSCYVFIAEGDNLVFVPDGGGEPWPAVRLAQ